MTSTHPAQARVAQSLAFRQNLFFHTRLPKYQEDARIFNIIALLARYSDDLHIFVKYFVEQRGHKRIYVGCRLGAKLLDAASLG